MIGNTAWRITVCGAVTVTGPAGTVAIKGAQPQAVVAYLTLERSVVLDELADLVGRTADADGLYEEATAQAERTPLVAARIESDIAQRTSRPERATE